MKDKLVTCEVYLELIGVKDKWACEVHEISLVKDKQV